MEDHYVTNIIWLMKANFEIAIFLLEKNAIVLICYLLSITLLSWHDWIL